MQVSRSKQSSPKMEFLMLHGSVGTLREAVQILSKNGKLMASITVLTILLNSLLFLLNWFSIKPLIDLIILTTQNLLFATPGDPKFFNAINDFKRDFGFFIEAEWIYVLLISIASIFLANATIFASAVIYSGKDLTFRNSVIMAARTWRRSLITWSYTALFCVGYTFLFCWAFAFPLWLIMHPSPAYLYSVLTFLATLFYVYLSVVWTLALVVSVLEETSGIEALGKAAQIVKGMKMQGFLLNLLFTVVSCIFIPGIKLIPTTRSTAAQVIIGLLVVNYICLFRIFWLMAYTVFYHHCKKTHGEEVELQGNNCFQYSKIPPPALIGEDVV